MRALVVVALLVPGTAAACPEISFGGLMHSLAIELEGTHEPVRTPLVIGATGVGTGGLQYGVSVGWGWGDKQIGGLFPGSEIRRVLVTVRRPFDATSGADVVARSTGHETASDSGTHVALTYGWFGSTRALMDAGIDVGLAGTSLSRFGPQAQVTAGLGGFGLRLAAGVELGSSTHVTASAELVLDVTVLARVL